MDPNLCISNLSQQALRSNAQFSGWAGKSWLKVRLASQAVYAFTNTIAATTTAAFTVYNIINTIISTYKNASMSVFHESLCFLSASTAPGQGTLQEIADEDDVVAM